MMACSASGNVGAHEAKAGTYWLVLCPRSWVTPAIINMACPGRFISDIVFDERGLKENEAIVC